MTSSLDDDKPYDSVERLILAMDIGTTNTAVSFIHAYPGRRVEVKMVAKWPGQEEAVGDSKIPTIVAYRNGEPIAFGAEAQEYLGDEEYTIAKWFKLHLHPQSMRLEDAPPAYSRHPNHADLTEIPPLPTGVTLKGVYSSFMRYLYNSSRAYFENTTPNGAGIWDRLQDMQHEFLKTAALDAGLVRSDDDAEKRIELVTEGEAECVQAGGAFVDRAARAMLESKLRNSKYGESDYLGDMERAFERKTKRLFDGVKESNVIDFGGRNDNDREFGILRGKITLNRSEVCSIFNGVIAQVEGSCLKLLRGRKVQHLLLVGGFGESPYLQDYLKVAFGRSKTEVVTVEDSSKKAAAEGAVIWFLKQSVAARAVRFSIGVKGSIEYTVKDPQHRARRGDAYLDARGTLMLRGAFHTLVYKDTVLKQEQEIRSQFSCRYEAKPIALDTFSAHLYAWGGDGTTQWSRDEHGDSLAKLRKICTIEADLSPLLPYLRIINGKDGHNYWEVTFHIALKFGGTRLFARTQWEQNGVTCSGPVRVVPSSTY
ncbi:hypothetical protein PIIN_08243 [Serendipita indica DSM 11827]|uniref:Uncharacterized protein n=1 Tax=Serendipita indica (strain DSM 11827) TaxID=1109443 RepID=G4TSJ7_SERID|nr:hypothetical protein PIIN_08243 [Serendipita indica DSM 11827]